MSFFKFQDYLLVYGYVENDYVNVYMTDNEISRINNNLKYKSNLLEFDIIEVSNNYVLDQNKLKRNVKLDFDFNKNEYILELYVEIGEETNVFEKIYQKYMKGVI